MRIKLKIPYSAEKRVVVDLQIFRTFIEKQKVLNKDFNKIFCIGFNKTGTTSLAIALKILGFSVGNQVVAEAIRDDWYNKRLERIFRYCETADAFQDVPFSLPGIYKELDKKFPNSKFILTIRDNPEQWFHSLVKFHTKLFSGDKLQIPTETDLLNSKHVYKGWILDFFKKYYDYPNVPLYDKNKYIEIYNKHIADVREYFKGRDNLLIINVSKKKSFQDLGAFLNVKVSKKDKFPWENKT